MKLKIEGKLRDGFFEWLKLTHYEVDYNTSGEIEGSVCWVGDIFDALPQSAQFGLIQEWGDSVGLICRTDYGEERFSSDKSLWFETSTVNNNLKKLDQKKFWASGCLNSRPEAQREAVKKLNEIYNK